MQKKPQIDGSILRERLISRESTTISVNRGSLSKCAIRFRDLLRALAQQQHQQQYQQQGNNAQVDTETDKNNEEADITERIQLARDELILELTLHDVEMRKTALESKATMIELDHYETLSKETSESIEQTRNEIDSLKQKLAHEQKVRTHREEYETLARMANKWTPVFATKRKLEQVSLDIEKLQLKKQKADSQTEMRRKQFQGLMQNIFDLKNSLEEDTARQEIEDNVKSSKQDESGSGNNTDDLLYGDLEENY